MFKDLILLKNKRFGSEKIWQKKSWKVLMNEIDDFDLENQIWPSMIWFLIVVISPQLSIIKS